MTTSIPILVALALCFPGCESQKGESRSRQASSEANPSSETAKEGGNQNGADSPTPLPKKARVRIVLGTGEVALTIPETMAAIVGDKNWNKKLALTITDVTNTGTVLHIAPVPFEATPDVISVSDVNRDASAAVKRVAVDDTIVLMPGQDLPTELFGSAPPSQVRITLLSTDK